MFLKIIFSLWQGKAPLIKWMLIYCLALSILSIEAFSTDSEI